MEDMQDIEKKINDVCRSIRESFPDNNMLFAVKVDCDGQNVAMINNFGSQEEFFEFLNGIHSEILKKIVLDNIVRQQIMRQQTERN